MSMIQIGCLLVGQTLNITILSLSHSLLLFSCCLCLCDCHCDSRRVVNDIVKLIKKIKKTTTPQSGEEKRERFESKLMFRSAHIRLNSIELNSVSFTKHGEVFGVSYASSPSLSASLSLSYSHGVCVYISMNN